MKTTQSDQILSYLKLGRSLTPISALDKFGCFRLAARVNQLRNQGHQIRTRMVTIGKSVRVASYSL
jgi:hypothetical protein